MATTTTTRRRRADEYARNDDEEFGRRRGGVCRLLRARGRAGPTDSCVAPAGRAEREERAAVGGVRTSSTLYAAAVLHREATPTTTRRSAARARSGGVVAPGRGRRRVLGAARPLTRRGLPVRRWRAPVRPRDVRWNGRARVRVTPSTGPRSCSPKFGSTIGDAPRPRSILTGQKSTARDATRRAGQPTRPRGAVPPPAHGRRRREGSPAAALRPDRRPRGGSVRVLIF